MGEDNNEARVRRPRGKQGRGRAVSPREEHGRGKAGRPRESAERGRATLPLSASVALLLRFCCRCRSRSRCRCRCRCRCRRTPVVGTWTMSVCTRPVQVKCKFKNRPFKRTGWGTNYRTGGGRTPPNHEFETNPIRLLNQTKKFSNGPNKTVIFTPLHQHVRTLPFYYSAGGELE